MTMFCATFLISYFEPFGLKQVMLNLLGRAASAASFRTSGLYRVVRHPIYLGIIVFWAMPTMVAGRLLVAAMTTACIFIGIALERHDLVAAFGARYRQYKARVGMFLPGMFLAHRG